MAPSVRIDSYDWNSDKTEMTARGATGPGQTDKLYLSNHSYGFVSGWSYVNGGNPFRVWEWNGDGASAAAIDTDFGRYNTYARDSDALAYNAPYFLMFRSAGNDRTENPSPGQSVALSPGGTTVVAYDPAVHPAGDAAYRAGFETIGFDALAKNVITIGSVTDAVLGGARSPSRANISAFSSWGPTDDGRIKPDLVANGDGVYSTLNSSDYAYGTLSGTSMATPNAAGTAALLVQDYARLFGGGAMRSATLKALLIHTADDCGHPGPDYKFGWGLLNGQAAADLLRDHADHPLKKRLAEDQLGTGRTTVVHDFVWDGVSPIQATLAWTDPAGTATTSSDLRTPRLRNNLDLRIVAPDGTEFMPFVMPFVGLWTPAAMDLPATTGHNTTDNIEQVRLPNPTTPGVYRAVVTFTGTLTNNLQPYSLLLTGAADVEPPPPPLSLANVTPARVLPGPATLEITGTGFQSGASVRLLRAGQTDRVATSVTVAGETLRAQLDLSAAAAGPWDVRVANPDGETATLAGAVEIIAALWSETFDGTVGGWTSTADTGANSWSLSTAQAHTPARSYFAAAPSTRSTTSLVSPAINVPAGATDLQLRFWHSYNLQAGLDGGRLEFSVGGAAWFIAGASGSGTSFASNGYTTTLSSSGNPNSRNEFAGTQAWSGNSGGFVETVVNLADTAKFAGKSLRARWRLATNNTIASPGWHLDTVYLSGGGDLANTAPVITTPAATASTETLQVDDIAYQVVRADSVAVSVAATDDGGAAGLTYTWTATSDHATPVGFLPNAGDTANLATAYFEGAGDYQLTVSVRDAQGLAATSSVHVRVVATAETLDLSPPAATLVFGDRLTFAATLLDQFGLPLSPQPAAPAWNVTGGGEVSADGQFTATAAGGPYTLTAEAGGLTGQAVLNIDRAPATVTLGDLAQAYTGTPRPVSIATQPPGLAVALTYDGEPDAPTAPGAYFIVATVTDPNHRGEARDTLVIRRGYDLWTAAAGLEGAAAAPDADPDGDGRPNLLEYALGASPLATDPDRTPRFELHDGYPRFTYHRVADPGLFYAVETSADLVDWMMLTTPGNPSTGEANQAGPVVLDLPAPISDRVFLRLRVTY